MNALQVVSGTDGGAAGTLLLFQYVLVNNNRRAFVFFDNGSSALLITHHFAKEIGLQGRPIQIHLITVGNKKTSMKSVLYTLTLYDMAMQPHVVQLYGLEEITADVAKIEVGCVVHHFASVGGD